MNPRGAAASTRTSALEQPSPSPMRSVIRKSLIDTDLELCFWFAVDVKTFCVFRERLRLKLHVQICTSEAASVHIIVLRGMLVNLVSACNQIHFTVSLRITSDNE